MLKDSLEQSRKISAKFAESSVSAGLFLLQNYLVQVDYQQNKDHTFYSNRKP